MIVLLVILAICAYLILGAYFTGFVFNPIIDNDLKGGDFVAVTVLWPIISAIFIVGVLVYTFYRLLYWLAHGCECKFWK